MKAIKLLKKHEQTIRQKFHVKKIGIFGSFARNEENKTSDVDILVEFNPASRRLIIIWSLNISLKVCLDEVLTW